VPGKLKKLYGWDPNAGEELPPAPSAKRRKLTELQQVRQSKCAEFRASYPDGPLKLARSWLTGTSCASLFGPRGEMTVLAKELGFKPGIKFGQSFAERRDFVASLWEKSPEGFAEEFAQEYPSVVQIGEKFVDAEEVAATIRAGYDGPLAFMRAFRDRSHELLIDGLNVHELVFLFCPDRRGSTVSCTASSVATIAQALWKIPALDDVPLFGGRWWRERVRQEFPDGPNQLLRMEAIGSLTIEGKDLATVMNACGFTHKGLMTDPDNLSAFVGVAWNVREAEAGVPEMAGT
jgi:hypothetical protein